MLALVLAVLSTVVWPLQPVPDVVGPFAPPAASWESGHRGVDLAGSPGQSVLAAAAGRIGFAGVIGGKPVVTVVHGRQRTTYEPVVATVTVGQEVGAGQPIGRLVVPGGHCFPDACLHWGLRQGRTYLDPLSLLGVARIRLLPLWRDVPVPDATQRSRPTITTWRSPLDIWGPALRR